MFEIITEMLPDIQKFESGFSFWFSPTGYKIDCAFQSLLSLLFVLPCTTTLRGFVLEISEIVLFHFSHMKKF